MSRGQFYTHWRDRELMSEPPEWNWDRNFHSVDDDDDSDDEYDTDNESEEDNDD